MYAQTYLFLDGRTEEALEFYKKAIGAQVTTMFKFKESPDKAHIPPGGEDKVMHAVFKIGDTNIMISDGMNQGNPKFDGFALSIHAKDEAEVKRYFDALVEGGEVTMPPTESFFAKSFGMLKDKFGVNWMVIAPKPM